MPQPLSSQSAPAASQAPAGDANAAFAAMVEAHYAGLGAFALRLVGSRAAAEDVVHEVLLRIWRRREGFAFDDPLAYLYRAVRHEATSWHRHQSLEQRRSAAPEQLDARPDPKADAASAAEVAELARAVEEAVAALPPRRREIFRMQREQGLSYAQIATLLGISPKTVEIQIGHALKAIRRRLAPFLALAIALVR